MGQGEEREGGTLAHVLASRKWRFSMSSAPGPIMSALKEAVVFRMCDTGVSVIGE